MKLSAKKWRAIVEMTRARMEDWKGAAAHNGAADLFWLSESNVDGVSWLITGHRDALGYVKVAAVAYDTGKGELFAAEPDFERFTWARLPAPPQWSDLKGAPADVLFSALPVGKFHMFTSSAGRRMGTTDTPGAAT